METFLKSAFSIGFVFFVVLSAHCVCVLPFTKITCQSKSVGATVVFGFLLMDFYFSLCTPLFDYAATAVLPFGLAIQTHSACVSTKSIKKGHFSVLSMTADEL